MMRNKEDKGMGSPGLGPVRMSISGSPSARKRRGSKNTGNDENLMKILKSKNKITKDDLIGLDSSDSEETVVDRKCKNLHRDTI